MRGEVEGAESVLVRVHSECLTGDVFHSLRCDCGEQLEQALVPSGRGGLRRPSVHDPGGQGHRPAEQAEGLRAAGVGARHGRGRPRLGLPADAREYGIGNQILADLGLTTIRILTNNPKKLTGIEGFGLTSSSSCPIETDPTDENRRYLKTKRDKLGHRLHHQDLRFDADRRMTDRIDEAGWFRPCPRLRWTGMSRLSSMPGGELQVPLGYTVLKGAVDGRRAVGIVVSKFNAEITNALLERALAELDEIGVPRDAVMIMPVPGAFVPGRRDGAGEDAPLFGDRRARMRDPG